MRLKTFFNWNFKAVVTDQTIFTNETGRYIVMQVSMVISNSVTDPFSFWVLKPGETTANVAPFIFNVIPEQKELKAVISMESGDRLLVQNDTAGSILSVRGYGFTTTDAFSRLFEDDLDNNPDFPTPVGTKQLVTYITNSANSDQVITDTFIGNSADPDDQIFQNATIAAESTLVYSSGVDPGDSVGGSTAAGAGIIQMCVFEIPANVFNENLDLINTSSSMGATTFLGLTDTPNSYAGEEGKIAKVNAGQTALEFVDQVPGGVGNDLVQSDGNEAIPIPGARYEGGGTPAITLTGGRRMVVGAATAANASVGIESSERTQAILTTRVTTAEKNALTALNGMWVYDEDLGLHQFREAGAWVGVGGGGGIFLGEGTTAQRDLESPNVDDLWWNTDRNISEKWDGDVWLNSQLVKVRNQTGGVVLEGQPVEMDGTLAPGGEPDVVYAGFAQGDIMGVVVDGDLTNGGLMTVAVLGRYNIYSTFTVTVGQFIRSLGGGDTDSLNSINVGTFAFALEDNATTPDVTPCYLFGAVRF